MPLKLHDRVHVPYCTPTRILKLPTMLNFQLDITIHWYANLYMILLFTVQENRLLLVCEQRTDYNFF